MKTPELCRRLFSMLTLLGILGTSVTAQQFTYATSKAPRVNQSISFSDFLTSLEQRFDVRINYNSALIEAKTIDKPDISSVSKAELPEFLNRFLKVHELSVERVNEKFLVVRPIATNPTIEKQHHALKSNELINEGMIAQQRLSGTVTDVADGTALTGVSVKLKDTPLATVTNEAGQYSLANVPDDAVLIFSYMGYRTQEVPANGRNVVDVQLGMLEDILEEVVVTALGIKREENSLGYAVQAIQGDDLQRVKGVDVGTTLTGRIAGLRVYNSTEFNTMPSIALRGMTPILVIDGVAYENLNLRDIPVDNIEDMTVLKGATATALYGSMGSGGAIMITTKKGLNQNGVEISVGSNNMFFSGYLALPEVQSSYSSGYNSRYNTDDYVWGDKLDIGRIYPQWDPISKSMVESELTSKGRNNFRNFLEPGFITNNSVRFTTQGEKGSISTSVSHVYNKGQYPNTKLNMTNISVSGETKFTEKLSLESRFGYNRRFAPNDFGAGYNNQGYIYNILVWTGPEYDLTQYKDYWLVKDEQQNWHYTAWYDNPYLAAHEKLSSDLVNKINAAVTLNYKITDWSKLMLRSGYDYYGNTLEQTNPQGVYGTRGGWSGYHNRGKYWTQRSDGFGTTNDLIYTANKNFGDFGIEGLAGGAIFYRRDNSITASTVNGISIPGFFSLRNSVDPISATEGKTKEMINSLYGRLSLSWKNAIFVEATGRNDWSSTLPRETRSYFYPSLTSSVVVSDLVNMPSWINLLKTRGSWAISKSIVSPYTINQTFSVSSNVWNGLATAGYPNSIRDYTISPTQRDSWEFGIDVAVLQNRLYGDYTRYYRLLHNRQVSATISSASGFSTRLINFEEEIMTRGHELTLGGTPVKKENFQWDISGNLFQNLDFYHKLDSVYSADNLWVKEGNRTDYYTIQDWQHTADGQVIHNAAGQRLSAQFPEQIGYASPKWQWGITNNFKYKDFALSFSFDGRVGGLSYSSTNARLWQTGSHPDSDTPERYEEVVNGNQTYVAPGVKVVSGQATYDRYGQITEDNRVFAPNDAVVSYETYWRRSYSGRQNVWDETFIKLREISLNYYLPSNIASKLRARNASIGVTGQNMFLWTKQYRFADPDVASDDLNSPSMRYLGFNINLNF